jgi:hypothetical protein
MLYNNNKIKKFVQDNVEYVVKDVNKISAFLFKKWGIVTSKKIKAKIDYINFILIGYIDFVFYYPTEKSVVDVYPIVSLIKAYLFFEDKDLLIRAQILGITFDNQTNEFSIRAKYVGLLIGRGGALVDNVLGLLNKSIIYDAPKYNIRFSDN